MDDLIKAAGSVWMLAFYRSLWKCLEEAVSVAECVDHHHYNLMRPWDASEKRYLSRRSLCRSIISATELVDSVAAHMYSDQYQWQRTMFGHTFSVTRPSCSDDVDGGTIVSVFRTWLRTHEEAQVMLASVLVVIGLWWLVRAVVTLVINLVCPLLVVLLAVVCVPQLRTPLLGQNYPAMASLLRNILLKMAENIKS